MSSSIVIPEQGSLFPSGHAALSAQDARSRLERAIVEAELRLDDEDVYGLSEFVALVDSVRRAVTPAFWRQLIGDVIAPHPLRPRLHEEPLTRRAFEKPRGYAGDAAMIDLIYRRGADVSGLTPLGSRLHEWAVNHSAFRSVQERRDLLADLIDQIASERTLPRILSLACGHLREAQQSDAVRDRAVREIVAVDQDRASLAVVEREQAAHNVTPVHASVRRFLVDPTIYGTFDLAYAAGLYDYLEEPVAISLTRAMFESLVPGGMLLVANFAPEVREIGYMECIMDWNLIYRGEANMTRLALGIPSDAVESMRISRDSCGNVVYLSIRKR